MTTPALVIKQISGACPVQAYGTYGEYLFYFRFRYDAAQLYVGPPDEDEEWSDMPANPPMLYAEINEIFNDPYRGDLNRGEAVAMITDLVNRLRPYANWTDGTRHERLAAYVTALVDRCEADQAGQRPTPGQQCPNDQPHEEHEWYTPVLRRQCRGQLEST